MPHAAPAACVRDCCVVVGSVRAVESDCFALKVTPLNGLNYTRFHQVVCSLRHSVLSPRPVSLVTGHPALRKDTGMHA